MTRIGLVSDTHFPRFGRALPRALDDGLRAAGVSRIFHMGDLTDVLAIPLFEAIAPLEAVAGNNDPDEIVARFGRRKIVTVEGVRVGLVHGDAGHDRNAHGNAQRSLAAGTVDVILYGHSHEPRVERIGGVLVANPGSPTDKRRMPSYSYGILTVEAGAPRIELFTFDTR